MPIDIIKTLTLSFERSRLVTICFANLKIKALRYVLAGLLVFSSPVWAFVITNDELTTEQNVPLDILTSQLLANDVNDDGKLKITYVDDWVNGQLTADLSTGRLTFTPNQAFIGQASFIYGAQTTEGEMGYAKVTITVSANDGAPVAVPNSNEVGKLFFLGNMSALTYSMQSMLSNISADVGFEADYDYQLGGFLFALWGDEISPNGGFQASGKDGSAQHSGVVYSSAAGFASGDYSTLIITDGGNAIPHMWGNTSQYLSRFANDFYQGNPNSQTFFLQSWPFIKEGNLGQWRDQIDHYLPRWKKVINTVNGNINPSTQSDSLYYIPEDEKLAQGANRLKLIPAALALSRVYDEYQQGNRPVDGRDFVSELFKSPDYSINPADNGQYRIGHLSPEGEYLVALVIHTAVYGRNPLLSTNNIAFNHRGWSGYSDSLFPQTPFPESGVLTPAKAQYYQQIALDVVSEFFGWDKTSLPARQQDSDGDGVLDNVDAFPNDASETMDSDGDGVGNNADVFPNDANETMDSDGDGVGDNADAFPSDASETMDSDGDGVGDNTDVFPNDASETIDSDGDGIGDNADTSPNGETDPSAPHVKLTTISFVNVEPGDSSVHIYWNSGNAIAFRILLMRHNQAPSAFNTTETEYTFTDLSVFDGVSTLMIEGYDSLENSIFSTAINVENL